MEVVWSNNQVSLLIELYQQHSILWDPSNKDYIKDKLKKNEAWADIAAELNMPQKEVETKMHTLRSQFCREKKKCLSKKSGAKDVIKSKWQWYDSLQFLLRRATGTSDTKRTDGSGSQQLLKTPIPVILPIPQSTKPKKRKCTEDSEERTEAYEIMKNAKNTIIESKDDFEIYGQYVASELKHVKDQKTLLQAKYYINNILIQARMGNLSKDLNCFGEYHGWRGHGIENGSTSTVAYSDASNPNHTPETEVQTAITDEMQFSIDETFSQLKHEHDSDETQDDD